MRRAQRSEQSDFRNGLTLVEMLMVVALLLLVAGMSFPAILNGFSAHTLRYNVGFVREQASEARVQAIESGLTYQFRYEPGKQRFVVIPYERESESPDASAAAPRVFAGELSERMMFRTPDGEAGFVERLDPDLLGQLPDAYSLAQASWSAPVLFFPDGSATDASFDIIDDKQEYITLTVRGLTAAISLSEIAGDEDR